MSLLPLIPTVDSMPSGPAPSRTRFLLAGLLKLIVAAACFVGAIAAFKLIVYRALAAMFTWDPVTSSVVRPVGIFLAMVLSYWGFVHFYERRTARELAPRLGWIVLAGVAGSASIGVTILTLYATRHFEVVAYHGWGAAGGVFGMLWIAAALEEIAFRGILFRLIEERIGTAAAIVGSSVIFAVAHLANNGAGWISTIVATLAGIMWAELFVLTRNLWVTTAHHCCWNSTVFLTGVNLSGETEMRASAPFETITHGSALWTGGAFGPENCWINLVVMTAICVGLWSVTRHRGWVASSPALTAPTPLAGSPPSDRRPPS